MPIVEEFAWNPRRTLPIPGLRRLRIGPRVNNFGDLVGPVVVDAMRARANLRRASRTGVHARLFSVGSVLHFASDGDTVWGAGVNGKIADSRHEWTSLDVRAVRGPLTRKWITESRRCDVPSVFGDPALLLFELGYPRPPRKISRAATFIPNLNDRRSPEKRVVPVSPREKLDSVLKAVAESEVLVTSSLHALLFAELMRVPVALMPPRQESPFKYLDYARGTGRDDIPMFDDFDKALKHARAAAADESDPLELWSSGPLIGSFPSDLFESREAI